MNEGWQISIFGNSAWSISNESFVRKPVESSCAYFRSYGLKKIACGWNGNLRTCHRSFSHQDTSSCLIAICTVLWKWDNGTMEQCTFLWWVSFLTTWTRTKSASVEMLMRAHYHLQHFSKGSLPRLICNGEDCHKIVFLQGVAYPGWETLFHEKFVDEILQKYVVPFSSFVGYAY